MHQPVHGIDGHGQLVGVHVHTGSIAHSIFVDNVLLARRPPPMEP